MHGVSLRYNLFIYMQSLTCRYLVVGVEDLPNDKVAVEHGSMLDFVQAFFEPIVLFLEPLRQEQRNCRLLFVYFLE